MKKHRIVIIVLVSAFGLIGGAVWLHQSAVPLQTSVSMAPVGVVAGDGQHQMNANAIEQKIDSMNKQINDIQSLYQAMSKKQNEILEKVDKLASVKNLYENLSQAPQVPSSNEELKSKEFLHGKSSNKELDTDQNQDKELNRLESEIATQDIDMAWSSTAENQILRGFSERFPEGSNMVAVNCRTTLCRIQVVHDSQEAKEHFIEQFPDTIPWDHEGFFYNTEDNGVVSSVAYITREANNK